jgi:hypothetical protein
MYCYCCLDSRLNIIIFRFITKVHINWIHTTGNIKSWGSIKILLKFDCIHSSRHDNKFKIRSFDKNLFNESKENISIKSSFMCLVEYNDGILFQLMIHHRFSQQHTISHVLKDSFSRSLILKPDGVPNFLSKFNIHLFSDSGRN